uniref:FHA domain-containing protein n=1 Tax=Cyprinodon variegatus TaxID=28743 RepID=A0A3Q2CQQ3_CYPVA
MDRLNRNVPELGRQTHQVTPLDLIETGKGLKFQAERPHLVSLGSGRLSTAITLLPLPEGRTTLGYGAVDINIQGPGVAAQHCYIENKSGIITLHPSGNLCAVDGLQVQQPIRLSQGRSLSAASSQSPSAAGVQSEHSAIVSSIEKDLQEIMDSLVLDDPEPSSSEGKKPPGGHAVRHSPLSPMVNGGGRYLLSPPTSPGAMSVGSLQLQSAAGDADPTGNQIITR